MFDSRRGRHFFLLQSRKNMPVSQILLTLLIIASWGSNAAISKIGIMEFEPIGFLAVRFFFTSLIFLPFGRVHKEDLKLLLLIALLLNVGHMGACFVAYKFLLPSSAMVLQQSQVPFALIVAALFAKEKITKTQIGGIILAICGVLFIFGLPELNLIGAFFAFGFRVMHTMSPATSCLKVSTFIPRFAARTDMYFPQASTPVLYAVGLSILQTSFQTETYFSVRESIF